MLKGSPSSKAPSISKGTHHSLRILVLALLCIGSFVFHIWFRTTVLTSGYEVAYLRREVSRYESMIADARVEKNKIMSPERLEHWVGNYKMQGVELHAPQTSQVFYLPKSELNVASEGL